MKLPRVGSRWKRRQDDGKVYMVTLAEKRSLLSKSPRVILVEEITGYPRCYVTPTAMKQYWTEVTE